MALSGVIDLVILRHRIAILKLIELLESCSCGAPVQTTAVENLHIGNGW
jgi:hypothetical protein